VVGGTGTIGRRVVAALAGDGHEVRALREAALTCPAPDVRGTRTFAEWLAAPATGG